jgi:hypothetical protein
MALAGLRRLAAMFVQPGLIRCKEVHTGQIEVEIDRRSLIDDRRPRQFDGEHVVAAEMPAVVRARAQQLGPGHRHSGVDGVATLLAWRRVLLCIAAVAALSLSVVERGFTENPWAKSRNVWGSSPNAWGNSKTPWAKSQDS